MDFILSHPVVIFVGVAASLLGLVFYLDWKRRRDLEQMAVSAGLSFSPDGPDAAFLAGTGIELFRQGRSRRASNLVLAASGQLQVFDYKYVTGSGRHSQTHSFTVALLAGTGEIPQFDLKPENFLHKLGEMIGFKDIDLPAFPEFSCKYRLTGPDEGAVRGFFTPRRAAWLESNPGLNVQGAPGCLLLIKTGGRLSTGAWPSFLEETRNFSQQFLR